MSLFPHSGTVLEQMREDIEEFSHTKSALHFTEELSVPEEIVRKMIEKRLETEDL